MAQITANGTQLEYDIAGPTDGPPLLLIMGFGSQMTSWPIAFRDSLAASGFRVIRFDNRDVGLSQRFIGTPSARDVAKTMAEGGRPDVPYVLNDMAADAAALLDGLGIESAHIAGASMGGMIAQLVALNHPAKARSLISIFSTTSDPSLPRSTPEAQAALVSQAPSPARADVVAHSVKNRRIYASTRWPFDEEALAGLAGASYDRAFYPEGAVRQYAAILASPPRTEALKRLRLPALVMHGTADTLIPWQAGAHTAASISGSEFVLIDGWGHDLPVPGVPLLTDYIAAFVRRAEAARTEGLARPAEPGCSAA
ncbi:Aclacinomycin methylesterase RdmC [Alphaproteobacteria bacterium SO-S41]|nr:Aclacinomycin methylesterase RdmC [Alphaproteobacteria bacterium SO-S41]